MKLWPGGIFNWKGTIKEDFRAYSERKQWWNSRDMKWGRDIGTNINSVHTLWHFFPHSGRLFARILKGCCYMDSLFFFSNQRDWKGGRRKELLGARWAVAREGESESQKEWTASLVFHARAAASIIYYKYYLAQIALTLPTLKWVCSTSDNDILPLLRVTNWNDYVKSITGPELTSDDLLTWVAVPTGQARQMWEGNVRAMVLNYMNKTCEIG